jgi:Protein of unknown function (DUF2001).
MSQFLHAGDIISGREGKVTFNINGNIEDGAYVKQLDASFEKQKSEINVLGRRSTQSKTTGWTGSGSMTLYLVSSVFREMAAKYAKTGKDTYFTVTIENEDATSTIGNQTVVLYNCNIDSVVLAKIDVDNTELEEDFDFTFDDFEILNSFTQPTGGN